MGVYVFSTDKLFKYLEEDEQNPDSENDFGKNVIPLMLAGGEKLHAYLYKGYWRDVGTLSSYWSANMDTLGDDPVLCDLPRVSELSDAPAGPFCAQQCVHVGCFAHLCDGYSDQYLPVDARHWLAGAAAGGL